jgi:hypothetical protein
MQAKVNTVWPVNCVFFVGSWGRELRIRWAEAAEGNVITKPKARLCESWVLGFLNSLESRVAAIDTYKGRCCKSLRLKKSAEPLVLAA